MSQPALGQSFPNDSPDTVPGAPPRIGVVSASGEVLVWRNGEAEVLGQVGTPGLHAAFETPYGVVVCPLLGRGTLVRWDGTVERLPAELGPHPVTRTASTTEMCTSRHSEIEPRCTTGGVPVTSRNLSTTPSAPSTPCPGLDLTRCTSGGRRICGLRSCLPKSRSWTSTPDANGKVALPHGCATSTATPDRPIWEDAHTLAFAQTSGRPRITRWHLDCGAFTHFELPACVGYRPFGIQPVLSAK